MELQRDSGGKSMSLLKPFLVCCIKSSTWAYLLPMDWHGVRLQLLDCTLSGFRNTTLHFNIQLLETNLQRETRIQCNRMESLKLPFCLLLLCYLYEWSKKDTNVPKSSIRKQAGRIRYFSVSLATSNSVNFATYLTMWEHMQVRDRMLVNTATKRSHSGAIATGIWTHKSAWTVPRRETILREVLATDTHI